MYEMTQSRWYDVQVVLDEIESTHGIECVNAHRDMIERAHREIMLDSDDPAEFDYRLQTYVIELVGPTEL